ncbi:melanocyte-stimulating hormone receptor-like [Actinia tenebrosa]|uniref:Melanocyte-stimulating hormone receptor-like n=1 Tax=Actinia tenebrosa TaxID=6105 RepID=A0A6P8JBG8_ACTTE|nr:melanocyte-stimulating hormone receptor-like [Actinia tenebrosa]
MANNFSCGKLTDWVNHSNTYLERSSPILLVVFAMLIPPAAILNALVLVVIWRRRILQTTSNLFLRNLALSDLAVAIWVLPLLMTCSAVNISHISERIICNVANVASVSSHIFGSVSFLTMTAATVDRYLALYLHLRYTAVVTRKRVIYSCIGLWLISIVTSIILPVSFALYKTVVVLFFSGSMMTIMFCYYKMYRILKYHHAQIQIQMAGQPVAALPNMNKYKSSVMNLVYIFLLYIVLYVPYIFGCMMPMENMKQKHEAMITMMVGLVLIFLNSTLNPLLYCWRQMEIRNAIKDTVGWRPAMCMTSESIRSLRTYPPITSKASSNTLSSPSTINNINNIIQDTNITHQ